MSRGSKRIAYGFLYLALIALVIFLIIQKNKNVLELQRKITPCDYGTTAEGECISSPIENPTLITPPIVLKVDESHVAILALIKNQNTEYGVKQIDYSFKFLDNAGNLITEAKSVSILYPGEERYLYALGEDRFSKITDHATFSIDRVVWARASEFLEPQLRALGVQTIIERGRVIVRGLVANESSLFTKNIQVIAILRDRYLVPLFAATTLLPDISGLEEKEFSVIFPESQELLRLANVSSSQIFVSSQ